MKSFVACSTASVEVRRLQQQLEEMEIRAQGSDNRVINSERRMRELNRRAEEAQRIAAVLSGRLEEAEKRSQELDRRAEESDRRVGQQQRELVVISQNLLEKKQEKYN